MSYADLEAIQGFVPKWEIRGDTNPSTVEVEAFVERLSARIDGIAAGRGYAIPLTGTQTLNIVESICLVGSAWYVGRTIFPNGNVEAVDDYRREFEQMILELTNGVTVLVDAGTSGGGVSTLTTATTDPCVASAMVPFFTRQMVF